MRIAINGFGRIGRAFFKMTLDEKVEVVAINDLGDLENLAYLLRYDTVYGRFQKEISVLSDKQQMGEIETKGKLVVDKKEILFFQEKDPTLLPWSDLKVDVVIEATGVFADYDKARAHINAGAKKVIITAPAKGNEGQNGRTVLLGINDEEADQFEVISNGSCTTNAVSSVIKILDEKIGIKKAVLNTIHAYTATQSLIDGPVNKDWLRGRAAASNILPSTTGAAVTVSKVIKNLENKFDGLAVRVPVICGSLADVTFVSQRETTVEEINQILKEASLTEKWNGILIISELPLASSDILQDNHPAIVDLSFTKVVDGDLIKVLVWYDNEWAYAWTLLEQIKRLKI